MMGSLYSGISGLKVQQVKMDVIGNNISNVNTVGFKKSTVNFEEALARTLKGSRAAQDGIGGTNAVQVGMGASVSNITTNFSVGIGQTSSRETDLRIDGNNGFFMVSDGNGTYYTRAGNFDLDASGSLVSSNGLKVQGWQATKNADGTTGIGVGAGITDLRISKGDVLPGKATTEATLAGNLDQRAGLTDLKITVDDGEGNDIEVAIKFTYDSESEIWSWKAIGPTGSNVAGNGTFEINDSGKISKSLTDIPVTNTTSTGTVVTIIKSPISGDIKFTDATSADKDKVSAYVKNVVTASNNVFDSLGTAHNLNITYTKIGQNVWGWSSSVSNDLEINNGKGFFTFDAVGQLAGNYVYGATDSTDPTRMGTYLNGEGEAVNSYPSDIELGISTDSSLYASYLQPGDDPATNTNPYAIDENGIITYRGIKDGTGVALAQDAFGNPITLPTLTVIPEEGEIMNVNYSGSLTFDPAGTGGAVPPQNGASIVKVAPSFSGISQFSSESAAKFTEQNGYSMGELESFKIGSTGDITGYYTNGRNQTLGRVALATFTNPGGLEKVGGSVFRQSANSGEAVVLKAGTGGASLLASQSLEMSNVDLAEEFTDMIVAQRGFQANSKTIQTADAMIQDLINLKR
jgi:flagellar hook protein FlgE